MKARGRKPDAEVDQPRARRHRPRPPRADLRGTFLITDGAVAETERLLTTYRDVDSDHEGLVFLAGVEIDRATCVLTTAIAPDCEHGPGRVLADESAIRDVAREARTFELAVLAQVHSHPGPWTGHSEGDDFMVLMPFEGMLSIVVPHYAKYGMRPLHSMGVHQYQEGRWRLASVASLRSSLICVPDSLDLR